MGKPFYPERQIQIGFEAEEYMRFNDAAERKLYLYGEIAPLDEFENLGSNSVSGIIEQILRYNSEDKDIEKEKRKAIRLYINSIGGDVYEGFALVETILTSETPVYTINIGKWASMAFYIGIAGHKRFSLQNMIFLLHEGYSGALGSVHQVQDQINFEKRYESEVIRPLVIERTKITSAQYKRMIEKECYMLPEEAKKLGVIDEIVTSLNDIL